MNKLTLGEKNFALTTTALAFMQTAYAMLEKLTAIAGDNIIISGCEVTDTSAASGYMILNGILMPFSGGTITENVKIVTTTETVTVGTGTYVKTSYNAEFGTSVNDDENVSWADIVSINSITDLMTRLYEVEDQADQNETDIQALEEDLDTKADKSNVLELDNEDEFTPSEDYHPSTKKYVDTVGAQAGIKLFAAATVSESGSLTQTRGADNYTLTCTRNSEGNYTVTHNLGTTDYFVQANTEYSSDTRVKVASIIRSANSFEITTADDDSADDGDFVFNIFGYTID